MAKQGSKQIRDNDFLRQVGQKIREYRLVAGLTQAELAERCKEDLDYSQIARIERGEVNFQISYLILISRSLGISPSDLLPT